MPERDEHELRAPEAAFDEKHDIPPSKEPGYETRDFLRRRLAMWFAIIISSLVVISAVITIGLHSWFAGMAGPVTEPMPRAPSGEFLPDAPLLQDLPVTDMHRYSERKEQTLESYGWVDRAAGTVHIPIERAMDEVVAEGLPYREDTPPPGDLEQ